MKNKELINRIVEKIKGDPCMLKTPVVITFGANDKDTMYKIVKDGSDWCLSSDSWVLPLNEMTNKELLCVLKNMRN